MTDAANDKRPGFTPAGLKAWNEALVKTGTEHLDLGMVRRGKQGLKDMAAEATPKPAVPPRR